MSATQKTTNYQLPIFVGSDIPSWLTDFNGAMNKIDEAIKGASTTGGVSQDDVDELQHNITQLTTKVNNLESTITELKSTLENTLVIGTEAAGVTADQYDKIKNVSFK